MVERVKMAISKAREARGLSGAPSRAQAPLRPDRTREPVMELPELVLDTDHLERERVVTRDKAHPAHISFDVLRTRLLRTFRENGWSRVAITSPTKGCGKTVISANLGLSYARQADVSTMLVDMDLKAPRLAPCLGVRKAPSMARYLRGETPAEAFYTRIGKNLVLGLNGERVRDSAELIQDERTAHVLADAEARFRPDTVIFDLPPMLVSDDSLAFMSQVDAVILVVSAGETQAPEIEECERLLADNTNFLGVILNKSTGPGAGGYRYNYYYGYGYGYGFGYGFGYGSKKKKSANTDD